MAEFDYIIDRLRAAEFTETPFRHVYLDAVLKSEHFQAIVTSREILVPPQKTDEALFSALFERGYTIIDHPGCILDWKQYIDWHRSRGRHAEIFSTCEGMGIALRLTDPQTSVITDLRNFLRGEAFNRAMAEKFGIDFEGTFADGGIQKYLDGYEISPHPDVRDKATTFMVNINPHTGSEVAAHHTHYLRLKPEYAFVQRFWESNLDCERRWLPWHWCETVSIQTRNNSMVLFAPGNDTLHAVKAEYDHLGGQRTQLYGNLWFNSKKQKSQLVQVNWWNLDIKAQCRAEAEVKRAQPGGLTAVRRAIGGLKRALTGKGGPASGANVDGSPVWKRD